MFTDVARYRVPSAESGEAWAPVLEARGILHVESGIIAHESDGSPRWEWQVTSDASLRWAHETQWSGDGHGLMVASSTSAERTLLVFESVLAHSDDSGDKARAALADASGLAIGYPVPDPPVPVAYISGAILRGSASCRDSMLACGVREGKGIEQRGETRRQEAPAVGEPKEVSTSIKAVAKGARECSGTCAEWLTCVTETIGACAKDVGAGAHALVRGPLRPVLDAPPVLSITTVLGAAFGSVSNLGAGAVGGVGACCTAVGTSCIEDVRHDHGDELADLTQDSIAVGTNVVSAVSSASQTATLGGVVTQAGVGMGQGVMAAESGTSNSGKRGIGNSGAANG